jgi:hypothetical protein
MAMDLPQNSGFFNMARDFTVTNSHFTEVNRFKQWCMLITPIYRITTISPLPLTGLLYSLYL